jgi:hypothetical protein
MSSLKRTLVACGIAMFACAGPEPVDTAAIDTGSGGGENEVP